MPLQRDQARFLSARPRGCSEDFHTPVSFPCQPPAMTIRLPAERL